MESLTVDFTYGEALFEAASQLNKIDELEKELDAFSTILDENPDFFEMLKSPVFSVEQKKEMTEKIFSSTFDETLLNFIYVLIDKMRMINYKGIVKEYKRLVDEREGFSTGTVYSVVEIPDEKLKEIERETGNLLQKNVKLKNEIDESLIGGLKIYIDGKLIDASIRRRLDDLKERLM